MWRVTTTFTGLPGTPWINQLHFDSSVGNAQDAVDAAGTFWDSCAGSNMANGLVIATEPDVDVVDEVTGDKIGVISTTPAVSGGTGISDPLPFANQVLIRLRTGVYVAGREIVGKIFIPAILESNSTGLVGSSLRTFYNGVAQALIDDVNCTLVVWSKKNGEAVPAVSPSTSNQFAVLRSRRD